jgi:hypothetical protein
MKDGRKVVGFAVQVIRVNSSPMSVVKTGSVIPSAGCLLCPDERTSSGRLGMSENWSIHGHGGVAVERPLRAQRTKPLAR